MAVFLGDRRDVVFSRQCADLSHVSRARPKPPPRRRGGGRPPHHPRRDQRWRRRHGGQYLYRQRPQLHGEGHRRGGRRSNAQFLRLHALQRARPDPAVRLHHVPVLRVTRGLPYSSSPYWSLSRATTAGSARVVVSPSAFPSAMSRRSRRMIFPDRVLGRSEAQIRSSGRASAPIFLTTWALISSINSFDPWWPSRIVTKAAMACPLISC